MKIKCHNCGNDKFTEKKVEEFFNINGKLYLIKNISALVCDRCDEKYFKPEVQRMAMEVISNTSRIISRVETEVYEI
jgi:HTH-type transcriptional regulator / antitoxin MqsA